MMGLVCTWQRSLMMLRSLAIIPFFYSIVHLKMLAKMGFYDRGMLCKQREIKPHLLDDFYSQCRIPKVHNAAVIKGGTFLI